MHAAEIAMVETNCKMPQGLKRFSVTMPNFDLLAPIDKYYHEVALREWTWTHHKDSILASMVFHYEFGQDGQKEQNEEKIDSNIVLSVIAAREELKQSPARQIELLGSMDQLQRQFFHSESAEGVFDCSLQAILDLMESEYGFIGETKHNDDGTMYLQTRALTNIAWNKPTRQFFDENIEQGLKFSNLNSFFGSVMITGKPVISNKSSNYKRACGLPEGHPPLDHFLGIPFFKPGGEISGMVGISNKAGGYSEKDIEFLEPLTVMCGNLIQAYLQIERNSYLINTLAESVKKRTQELELTNTDLKEANTRVRQNAEMKLEHFACMSHEIRTPLNCIIGMSSLLKDTKMTPMQEESMRMIITSGDLLLAVVNDVLDYSKLEIDNVEIDVKLSDMQDILSCIIQSIEMKSQSTQSIKPYSDVRLPQYVHIDSRRVQQILFNLLGNAIKFSKKASVVELTVELVRCPCPLGTGDDHRSTCSSGGHDQSNDEAFSPATGSPTLTANMTILLKDTAARLHVAHFTRLPLATKICLIYRKRLRELETDT